MAQKEKRHRWRWLLLVIISLIAAGTYFYFFNKNGKASADWGVPPAERSATRRPRQIGVIPAWNIG